MVSLTAGVVGGLVATVLMTVVMKAIGDDSPPPTAALVAKVAGGDPPDHLAPGMLLHLLYGTVAGLVFALALPELGFGSAGLPVVTGLGLVYGVLLTVGGMVFWMKLVLGMDPEPGRVKVFVTVHLVYGLVLGGIVGAPVL